MWQGLRFLLILICGKKRERLSVIRREAVKLCLTFDQFSFKFSHVKLFTWCGQISGVKRQVVFFLSAAKELSLSIWSSASVVYSSLYSFLSFHLCCLFFYASSFLSLFFSSFSFLSFMLCLTLIFVSCTYLSGASSLITVIMFSAIKQYAQTVVTNMKTKAIIQLSYQRIGFFRSILDTSC